mmetsp:Transcript_46455/g.87217  ORF Transcript_46455/g.87217 Transcript_46455/m.87217 type:complete len:214 (-) Transcript_46455:2-643(-)
MSWMRLRCHQSWPMWTRSCAAQALPLAATEPLILAWETGEFPVVNRLPSKRHLGSAATTQTEVNVENSMPLGQVAIGMLRTQRRQLRKAGAGLVALIPTRRWEQGPRGGRSAAAVRQGFGARAAGMISGRTSTWRHLPHHHACSRLALKAPLARNSHVLPCGRAKAAAEGVAILIEGSSSDKNEIVGHCVIRMLRILRPCLTWYGCACSLDVN